MNKARIWRQATLNRVDPAVGERRDGNFGVITGDADEISLTGTSQV
jgi:hypothetical protein